MVERRLRLGCFTLVVSAHAQERMVQRSSLLPRSFNLAETARTAWETGNSHREVLAGGGLLVFERRDRSRLLILKTFSPAPCRV